LKSKGKEWIKKRYFAPNCVDIIILLLFIFYLIVFMTSIDIANDNNVELLAIANTLFLLIVFSSLCLRLIGIINLENPDNKPKQTLKNKKKTKIIYDKTKGDYIDKEK